MKSYTYYWYHHMIPIEEQNKISQVIQNKDYFGFIELYREYSIKAIQYGKYYEEFSTWCPMIFLPDTISVYDSNTGTFEYISILEKENFEKITYSECECG